MPTKKKKPKPKLPSYADSTYQNQLRGFDKVAADELANMLRSKGRIGEEYGTEGSAAVAAITEQIKKALTKSVAKNKKELHTERKPIRKAELERLIKSDKDHKVTKKELVKYKELAKGVARKKVSTTKQVPVMEQIAKSLEQLKKERAPVRKQRYQTLLQRDLNGITAQERAAYKEKAKAFARKKVALTTPRQKYTTTTRTVTPAKAAQAATEGKFQRELRDSQARDLEQIQLNADLRGASTGGGLASAMGASTQEFQKQLAEINRQRANQYQDVASRYQGFQRQQELAKEQARQDAIRRRQQAIYGGLGY